MDDESSKINVNTAFGKPRISSSDISTKLTPAVISTGVGTYPLGHPASVNLDALDSKLSPTGTDAQALAATVNKKGNLITIDDVIHSLKSLTRAAANRCGPRYTPVACATPYEPVHH